VPRVYASSAEEAMNKAADKFDAGVIDARKLKESGNGDSPYQIALMD